MVIQTNSKHGRLILRNMQLSVYSSLVLSKIFKKKTGFRIRQLNLTGNNIADTGVKLLCDNLPMNKALFSLNLCSNNITHVGAIFLFEALALN